MKNLSKLCSVLALSSAILVSSVAAAAPGYVDFGSFEPSDGHEFVEVNLDRSMLKIASIFAEKQDVEIARLISGIERLRVNVVGFDDSSRGETLDRVERIRAQLTGDDWKRVVTMQEKSAGDNVAVFVKLSAQDIIQGVVVTVMGRDNEAVLVNIVGEIDPVQIAALGERLDIAPLRKLKLASVE